MALALSIVHRVCMAVFYGRDGYEYLTTENGGFRPEQMRLSEQHQRGAWCHGAGLGAMWERARYLLVSSQDAHTVVLYYNTVLSLHASLISSSRAAPGCSHDSPQAAPHAFIA